LQALLQQKAGSAENGLKNKIGAARLRPEMVSIQATS